MLRDQRRQVANGGARKQAQDAALLNPPADRARTRRKGLNSVGAVNISGEESVRITATEAETMASQDPGAAGGEGEGAGKGEDKGKSEGARARAGR